ncbi:MAG: peptidyl-prolyl cis-trans isomerase [Acidobacteriota bacterium]
MFDLFRSRAKAVRYLLGGLLMVVALSMVVTLIPGWGSMPVGEEQVVAEIGDEALTEREVQLQLQAAMRNKAFPSELAYIYVPQMIDQMITERVLAYQSERLGFQVTEADVAQTIRSMIPQLYQDGKFVGRQAYADFLAQQNLTIPQFEANVRKQMLLTKLRNLAGEGAVVTPEEIDKEYRRRNEKVKLEYVAISPDKLRSQATVTPEEVKAHFEKNRPAYQIPEKRSFEMLVIDEAKIGERIATAEADLRRAYEANKEQYRTPERVNVRHILLKTTEKPKEEVPKIQARAAELLKQIRGGADFAELARKNSEDPGSAAKGGELSWVARGQTVKAFEDTAFTLKPNQISDVISTEYGFHILQVLQKEEARLKPFEEVKEQLAKDQKRQQVFNLMQNLADQAQAELSRNPQQAASIAQRLNVPLVRVEKAGRGDPVPEIGVSPEFEEAISGLQKGRFTPPIQVQGNKLVIAVLADVFPIRPAELAEVEKQVREQLASQKVAQLVEQRAREAMEKAQAAGGDLKKVAQAMGLELKTTQEFGPDGAADGIGPATSLMEAFTKEVGGLFGPVPMDDNRFVCRVAAKTAADTSKLAEQREAILTEIKRRKARDRDELFTDSLRTRLIQDGKVKIHEDVIRRLASAYRG